MDGRPDCTRCRHFVVTWRPETPRGCRVYGFEGQALPAVVVERTTGRPCGEWEPRPDPARASGNPPHRGHA